MGLALAGLREWHDIPVVGRLASHGDERADACLGWRHLAEPDRAGERDAAEMQGRLMAHVVDERRQQSEQRFTEVRSEPLDLVDVPRALTRHPSAHLLVGHFNGGLERRQPLPLGYRMPVENGQDRLRDAQPGIVGAGMVIHALDSFAGP